MASAYSGHLTELRVRRNPRRVVQLELAFLVFLAVTIWSAREILG